MIYSIYFAAMHNAPLDFTSNRPYGSFLGDTTNMVEVQAKMHGKNTRTALAGAIKASKGDTFVFITTRMQEKDYDGWVETNGLKDYMVYEMPYYITNGNHPGNRNLKLHVMQSKEQ